MLLEAGVRPDSRAYPSATTPLTTAAAHGNFEATEALIDADVSTDGLLEPDGVAEGETGAWLQSSAAGFHLYQKLGFQTIATIQRWFSAGSVRSPQ